jgi:lysyl-tRNA synthetase class 2
MTGPLPLWAPERHRDRRPALMARNRIRSALRHWFEARDFIEVEAGHLQISPGNETHLHALAADLRAPDGSLFRYYLHTSPEFACKKLLAAGERRIFDFARVFRDRERGTLHSPEFTMLEWYRVEEPYDVLMEDCAAVLRLAAEASDVNTMRYKDRTADPFATPERITVAEAFAEWAGIDLLATTPGGHPDRDALAALASGRRIRIADDDSWSDIFSRILVDRIEPRLGHGRPALLTEYPVHEAALARPKPGDPRVAERFELYACGVELANGFGELTDAREQRRRFIADMDLMQEIYGERYPIDEEFLAALAIMPPASGIALGFDRLVMLMTGAPHIDDVLWTPVAQPHESRKPR